MVHIKKIMINGFASFDHFELNLINDSIIITGTNGVGKSNFFEIINIALNNPNKLNDYKNNNEEHVINIEFELTEKEYHYLEYMYVYVQCSRFFDGFKKYDMHINSESLVNEISKIKNKKIITYQIKCINNIIPAPTIIWGDGFFQEIDYEFIIDSIITITNGNHNHINNLNTYIKSININFENITLKDFKKNKQYFAKQIGKYVLLEYNNDNNKISYNKYENKDDYCAKHIHIKFFDREIPISSVDVINFMLRNNVITGSVLLHQNMFPQLLSETDPLKSILHYIKNECTFLFRSKYISKHDMLLSFNNIKSIPSNNNIVIYNKMAESVNNAFTTRSKLYDLSINHITIYEKVKIMFKNIMNKEFDIIVNISDYVIDYEYKIKTEDGKYNCSNGETELIDFLTDYYRDDKQMIFIDEPCVHLSSQNKNNFRKHILSGKSNKQIIIITHNSELISNNCNIIHFQMKNNKTNATFLQLNEAEKKNLYEHWEVLFSENILFIEGYHDYKLMKCILENANIDKYNLIILGGCGNKIWKIMNELNINFKAIYDFDVLNDKKENILSTKSINFLLKQSNGDKLKYINIMIDDIEKKRDIILNRPIIFSRVLTRLYDSKFANNNSNLNSNSLFNSNIEERYDKDNKNKINDYCLIMNNFLDQMMKNKNNCDSIIMSDFITTFENIYDEIRKDYNHDEIEKFEKSHSLHNFIDPIIKEKIRSTINITPDEIAEDEIKCGKYFIWNSTIKDLEGLGKRLFNNNDFKKIQWHDKTTDEIMSAVRNNSNDKDLQTLIKFLSM